MESRPQNPEFRNNPEKFHPCLFNGKILRFSCHKNDFKVNSLSYDK